MDDRDRCAPSAADAEPPFQPFQPPRPLQPRTLPAAPFTVRPPPDAAAWAAAWRDVDIPVLADTAAALEALRADEDAVDANSLGELIATDPLMTLKLLVHFCTHRPARVVTDPATVIGVLVMMGISPFFRAFGRQPSVEDRLSADVAGGWAAAAADDDEAGPLAGLRQVLTRARRAARFALAVAVQRADHHAADIHQAALLHDFAELLLWCHAPLLARRIAELQRVDPSLRSDTVQRVVLNTELPDLQRALLQTWQLPEPLARAGDPRHADQPGVRCVLLAVRLARHTSGGWHDGPALADDVGGIASLLGMPADEARAWLQDVDR